MLAILNLLYGSASVLLTLSAYPKPLANTSLPFFAIATEAPVSSQRCIKDPIVLSSPANSLSEEMEFVSLTFTGTSFSVIVTLFSTAPGS